MTKPLTLAIALSLTLATGAPLLAHAAQPAAKPAATKPAAAKPAPAWVAKSNEYADILVDFEASLFPSLAHEQQG